jgi:hypothetical protein
LNKDLHIITLDVPYPPDYGGMIDTYYRIKTLSHLGVQIHLHCFKYGRPPSPELESLCTTINYYNREPGLIPHLTLLPYSIKSRNSDKLLKNLQKDDFPILFDGIHTTFHLVHPSLSGRKKFVRTHNIEHHYYSSLSEYDSNTLRKLYFKAESLRLRRYEKVLNKADGLFAIAPADFEYFNNKYHNAELIMPFHPFIRIESQPGVGEYCLYHSNLSVSENIAAAEFLITKVFSKVHHTCILAGKNPPGHLFELSSRFSNIRIIPNPDNSTMTELIRNAQINILPGFAVNGLKLKLLIALCSGRHCIANETMIRSTRIEELCHIANTAESMIENINILMHKPFTEEMITARERVISEHYNNVVSGKKIISLIFSA